MKGAIYKKATNNKYYPYIYDKDTKKKKWGKGYTRKADAEKELRKLLNDYDNGKINFGRSETFEKIFEDWKQLIAPTLYSSEDSFATSVGYIANHLLPKLENKKIDKITQKECQLLFHEMKSKNGMPLSDATKKKILGIANSIFRSAIEWGYLSVNPCENVKLKSPKQTEKAIWNNEQLNYFLELCCGTKYHLPFFILATTGMRRGEVCALKWKNYDGESLILTHSMDKSGNLTEMKTSSSHRKVTLMQTCISEIEAQKVNQGKILAEIGNKSKITQIQKQNGYICTDEWNKHILPENLTMNFRRTILKNNQDFENADLKERMNMMHLPVIRLHDLRHGFATFAISSGEHIKVVSEILGHAKTSTTQNIYSHATETMQKASINRIEDLMFSSSVPVEKESKAVEK